ncbi:MAG TPA: carboxypeptidase regulatory-like domain-containing protein, partial [Thermoanaerobaculia bacterium]
DGGAVLGRGLGAGAAADHTAAGGGVVEIVVAAAGRVEGTVRLARDGVRRGLAGAALTYHPLDRETGWPPVVVAGPGGRYAATGLPPGRYAVSALAGLERRVREVASPGRAGGEAPNVVTVRAGERALHDVELELPPAVRGRVLDATGRPVGGAAVALVPEREPAAHLAFDPAGPRTDAAGRFELPLLWIDGPQRLQVAALRRGHSPARSAPFAVERGPGGVPRDVLVDVHLADEAPVRLRVTAGGAPVAGARVAVLVAEPGGWGRLPPVEMLLAAPGAAVAASREGVADLFLAPGSYRLGVAAAGYQTAVQDLEVPAPRPLAVEVALARGFEIAGRVVRGGRPVANVLVHLGSRVRGEEPQVTGADGGFRLRDLAAGEHRLVVVADDGRFRAERTATAPATGLVIELPPAGALALTVTDRRSGAPVENLAAEVLATGEEGEGAIPGRGARHHGGRGEGGRLVLDGLPVGEVEVTVGAAGYLPNGPRRVTIEADRTAELAVALDPGAALAGRVVDEEGEPVAGAQVHALPARPPERGGLRFGPPMATTEADGSYRLTGLAAGPVTLQVHAAGFVAHREELEVRGDQQLDVRLSRGLVLSGVVTAGGEPIPGAQVGASSAALAGQHQAAVSGDDGRFTLTGLVAARYTVSAFKEGHGHRQVEGVHPREVRELVLDLGGEATAVVEGVVRGLSAAAAGAAAATTVAAHGDSGGAEAPVEPDGAFRIERVPAGVLRVQAWVASEEGTFQSSPVVVEVGAGETAWVELEFGAAVRVTGRVTLDGEPAVGARVAFGGPDGAWSNAVADAAGEYRAALPRPGRYVVSVHDEPRLPSPYQEVHEIEGDRRLDLDVRERRLSGSVLDAATGEPLREAYVTLYSAAAPGRQALVAEAMTDRRGRFALPLSGPGPYELIAGAEGYGQARVETAGDGEVVLELTPVGALAVRVVEGAGGEPLQAHLVVRDEAGLLLPVRGGPRPDGTHHLSLAPGRYLVTAIAPGYGERTVAVRAPGELEIALGPAGHLLVETAPGVAGRLHLVGADGVEHQSCCGDPGWEVTGTVTSIRGLAAGRYTLELRGADGRVLAAVPVAVEPGATARARIG